MTGGQRISRLRGLLRPILLRPARRRAIRQTARPITLDQFRELQDRAVEQEMELLRLLVTADLYDPEEVRALVRRHDEVAEAVGELVDYFWEIRPTFEDRHAEAFDDIANGLAHTMKTLMSIDERLAAAERRTDGGT